MLKLFETISQQVALLWHNAQTYGVIQYGALM